MDLTYQSATALIDTGATVSGIGPRLVDELNIQSWGKNRLRSATEEVFVPYYLFSIGFFTTDQLETGMTSGSSLPFVFPGLNGFGLGGTADFDVILGMDVLGQCDMTLTRDGYCAITYG